MVPSNLVKKNLVFSFSEKLLRAALTFISLAIVARYLGPTKYGFLNYLIALVTYFQLLGAFGLDHVLMRILAHDPENQKDIFWSSMVFKALASLLSLSAYVIYLFINNELSFMSLLFGSAIFFAVLDNCRILLETRNQHHVFARVEVIYQTLSAGTKILVASNNWGVNILMGIFVLDFLVGRLLLFIPLSREVVPIPPLSLSKEKFSFYFKAGGFYCLSAILVIIYMKIDQVLVAEVLGMEALGHYAAAVRISDAWYFLPMTVSSVLYPLALGKSQDDEGRYLQAIFDLTMLVAFAVITPALFFNDEIFNFVFGQKFDVDKEVLTLLFLSGFFISMNISTAAWLNVRNSNRILFLRSMIGAVVNISLNLVLLPKVGIKGAAWATLVTYAITIPITLAASGSKTCLKYLIRSLNPLGATQRVWKVLIRKS